ncbi:unnamed protein product [Caenorhabditis nigoni]
MSSPDGPSELSLEQLRNLRRMIREELEQMENAVKEAKQVCEICEKDFNGELHDGLIARLGVSPIEDNQIKALIKKKEEKLEKAEVAVFEAEKVLEDHRKEYVRVEDLIKNKKFIIESTGEEDNNGRRRQQSTGEEDKYKAKTTFPSKR